MSFAVFVAQSATGHGCMRRHCLLTVVLFTVITEHSTKDSQPLKRQCAMQPALLAKKGFITIIM